MTTVLLIDDDRLIRAVYGDALRDDGFEVVCAESAEAAVTCLLKGAKFDLVVTDILLARMDGWELLRFIRQELKLDEMQLPVIVISAVDSPELEGRALHRGANGCLIKPVHPIEKLTSLARTLTGRMRSKYHDGA